METIDRDIDPSLLKAETAFKKQARKVIRILNSNGVTMEEEGDAGVGSWRWHNSGYTEDFVQAEILVSYNYSCNIIRFCAYILFPNRKSLLFRNDSVLKTLVREMFEEKICKKYPLTKTFISVTQKKPKIPAINTKEIAYQLHTAMLLYEKKNSVKITSMINKAEKRINELIKKEAGVIVESLFQ